MKLYIGRDAYNSRDQTLVFYGEAESNEEIIELCDKYLDEHNYNKYGYRRWICDKDFNNKPMWIVDFGSWSRFFYICELSGELLDDWIKLSKGNLE